MDVRWEETDEPRSGPVNDPWLPCSPVTIQSLHTDPLHAMITSERYIASLESKLEKVQGKNRRREPNSRDIIEGLTRIKEDHMARFISQTADRCFITDSAIDDPSDTSPGSLLQRRLHPEKQALNPEEVVVLVNEDELTKMAADKELVLAESYNHDLPSKPEDS